MIQIVQNGHEGAPLCLVQLRTEIEDVDLVLDVEVRRRLVEQQQRRLLGERHGDPDPLPLPAGQFVDIAIGKRADSGRRHRFLDNALVVR